MLNNAPKRGQYFRQFGSVGPVWSGPDFRDNLAVTARLLCATAATVFNCTSVTGYCSFTAMYNLKCLRFPRYCYSRLHGSLATPYLLLVSNFCSYTNFMALSRIPCTEYCSTCSSTPFCFVVRILVTPPRVRPYTLFDVTVT